MRKCTYLKKGKLPISMAPSSQMLNEKTEFSIYPETMRQAPYTECLYLHPALSPESMLRTYSSV